MDSEIDLGIDQLRDAEVIGRGGFSTVYAATDSQFDRRVAVKVLGKLVKESDRTRFERECRVMGRLSSHPNVVTVYHAGYTNDDEPYLTMELNQDGSLADLLKARGLIGWKEAVGYLIPIADALQHAHDADILHRDIKPENILIAGKVPRLTDFGIAYLRDSTGSASTNITASWLHTAPETFDNKRDERSDVYSAASTLYNLIAGRAPLENPEDESLNPLMRRLLNDAPPPLPTGTAPAALDAYLLRCLAKDPAERPQRAADFAEDLQLILDSGGTKMPAGNGAASPGQGPGPGMAASPPFGVPDPGPGRPNPDRQADPMMPAAGHPGAGGTAAFAAPDARPAPPVQQPPVSTPQRPAPPVHGFNQPGGTAPPQGFTPSGQTPAQRAPGYGAGGGGGGSNPIVPPTSGGGRSLMPAAVVVAVLAVLGLLVALVFAVNTPEVTVERADAGEVAFDDPPAEDDDSEVAEDEPPAEDESETPEPGPDVQPPTFSGPAASIEELEGRWAESRAAVVTALSDDAYGVGDDNVLRGPGGFEVDLGNCPAGWSDDPGIGEGTIRIGHTTAQTGSSAAFGNLGAGMAAYFDHVNANGGIDGLNLELVIRDDANNPANTQGLVDELVTGDQVLAVSTTGTPNSLATYDVLNADCIPQPYVLTAHPAFGDPAGHPFTSGLLLSWATEARLWGEWIRTNFADQLPVTVAAVIMDNDFGLTYETAFDRWMADNPGVVDQFIAIPHDPTATTLEGELAVVAEAAPEVYISMTAGVSCANAISAADALGLDEIVQARFQPSVCRDASFLPPGGAGTDGFLVFGGGVKSSTDPTYADDVYVAWVNDRVAAAGIDNTNGLGSNGFGFYGWTLVEALRIAAELPGGVTRTNLVLAMRGMHHVHPMLLDGITFANRGDEDAFLIEGSDLSVYNEATASWQVQEILDLDGTTPNCAWGTSGC